MQDEDLEGAVCASIANIAAVCLATNYPTLASVPHSIINAYKDNILALGVMLEDYTFPQVRSGRIGTLLSSVQRRGESLWSCRTKTSHGLGAFALVGVAML